MKLNKDTDMTRGNIWLLLLKFSLPMMFGLLFQQLYNTVDAWVVGKFVSKEALAAVGCNSNVINTVVGAFAGLAAGAGVVISQAYGAHNDEMLQKAVHTTMALTLLLSAVGTAAGVIFARPLLNLTNPDPDVVDDAMTYLVIYFAGVSGLLIYNMGTGILRAVGDSTRPVYFLVISAVVNTALDLLFVLAFDMGVAGVALATVIAEGVSAVLVLYVLMRSKESYGLKLGKLRIHTNVCGRIFALGLPSSIQTAITSFSNVFVQAYINTLRTDGMAGWTAYNKLDAFLIVPVMAIGMASTTFVGQCWGAGERRRAREGVKKAMIMALASTLFLTACIVAFARPLLGIFIKAEDTGVMEYGLYFVRIISPFYFTICFNQIYSGALRGIGNATSPTIVMLSSFVAFRQLFLYVSTHFFGGGKLVLALAYPLGWVLCSTLLIILYLRSGLCKVHEEEII